MRTAVPKETLSRVRRHDGVCIAIPASCGSLLNRWIGTRAGIPGACDSPGPGFRSQLPPFNFTAGRR